ncbi:MAG: alpha-mannosidase [bacterium ADurb.Bin478]|nr:MAG: alpha-mannosidase [bacterium ADurb.Bin478]
MNHEYPVRAIDHIWKGRLWVHEHNWGGTNGRISDAVKLARAREGYRLADEVNRDALAALAGAVSVQNRGVPLVVFNSLAWPRRDIVDPIVSLAEPGQREPRLVDGSGRTVAAQFNVLARHADGSIARIRTIFTADAPALGYATFYLSQGKESTPNPFKISDHEIENRFYRVRLDPRTGGIASIYDKQNQREWIKSDVYRAHELVAMENLGVDEAEEFTEKWWRMDEKPVAVTMTERGPVRTTFRIEGTLLNSRTIQTISLYADLPRIDLETRLNWNGQKAIQVNAAFPFHLPNGRVTYEVPFGDVEYGQENPAAKACHPTVRAANNWIDLSNEEMGITLATEVTPFDLKDRRDERFRDARVIQGIAAPDTFHIFWGGAYTPFTRVALTDPILLQTDFVIQPILLRSVFSCGDANLYFTQPGEHVYRFSITTHPGALVRHEATRQGLEHNAPLQVVCVKAGSGTRADSASFISVSQPNVIVSVVKKAEKGKGLVLRCYETDGQDAQVTMAFAKPVRAAWHTDLIERDGKPAHIVNGRLVVAIGRHAIETYRLVFE